ncbi:RNA-dependent ATPase rok1 [Apophysomyces ossiformis]|uniref:RNA helicase n=1 Tax=Apophysomyces ossiformis TaxID=679940 RepID=A0A8H7BLX9_9FUNG|nr:RNA-dependent ATPase rok1 [Apophysomyces ossiformis]
MDFFHLLGSGAKFDKKRFKEDVELFEAPNDVKKAAKEKNAIATDPNLRSKLLEELDFFKTEAKGSKSRTAKNTSSATSIPENVVSHIFSSVEEANIFRKKHRIRIQGTDVPNPFCEFTDLASAPYNLDLTLYNNLMASKYTTPTPIQMQSLPIMLKGRDLMACAPTGSGKTLAYVLPILQDLGKPQKAGCRAVIIAPTRELATQINREVLKMTADTKLRTLLLGKEKSQKSDKKEASQPLQKFDILISTPLRLVYAIKEKEVDLSNLRHLILDEADKLLELGFLEQTDEIFSACPTKTVQKALFSATFSSTVEELAKSVMKDPIRVIVGTKNSATDTIKQELLFTGNEAGKMIALRQYIQKGVKPPVLIFVQSIDRAKELFQELMYDGLNVQRDQIIDQFRLGKVWVLIATELMARGLDFKGVNLVINYDFPQTVESYIHRIGRTGRAGRAGEAITYYTQEDLKYVRSVVNVMKESGCEVPDWMLQLKKPGYKEKRALKKVGVKRDHIDTKPDYIKKAEEKKKQMIEASKKRKRKQEQAERKKDKKPKKSIKKDNKDNKEDSA